MTTHESAPDPTAGERCPRNPEPPNQRCGNVVCDGNHRDYPNDPRVPETRWTTPATPDADDASDKRPRCPQCGPGYRLGDDGCRHTTDDASEPLTEAEREALNAAVRAPQAIAPDMAYVYAAVERIKAAAATKARADERERIAQAIEAVRDCWDGDSQWSAFDRAARIARGDA